MPVPEDWQPQTTVEVIRGKTVRVWRWKGHELAYRGTVNDMGWAGATAWNAFRAETWAIKARLEAGDGHTPYAHKDRHDAAKRQPEHQPSAVPALPAPAAED